ncbi:short chain dehydrogenase [Gloeomargarita lithophora Alchichica-D10]|uniref:Short chain dehydrogenase n=1 Tax=Gloeomargarita lithophora Alchichica-D10 TaxID=1188229 RepID=A0A1J0ABU7_9CYAN|nr:SDR family oxidoreductase [Gloeomargarita lithophora]APB33420.1 short chain dehydrogenase [Gloeomargarita lithophora Alchichica-D10]
MANRCAVITGASRGIGRWTALELAKHGWDVALIARSEPELTTLAEEIAALGQRAYLYPQDMGVVTELVPLMHRICQDLGGCDVLVNNAGVAHLANVADTPLAEWERILAVNLTAAFQCIQGILPTMRAQKQGTIINVVSIAGQQVFPQWGAYCVSKYGLLALSHTLAQEERPYGIRVCALCPGAVDTPIWETVPANFDRSGMLSAQTVAQTIRQMIELPAEASIETLTLLPQSGVL